MMIFGFALFAIGIILVIVAPINKKKSARCSAQAQGTLVDIYETDSSDGNVGHTHVYSYVVNGIEYQHKSTAINNQVNKAGDPCTIWYNPSNPKDAQEFRYGSNRVFTIILIIGIVLILLGIGLTGYGCVLSYILPSL